MCMRQEPGGRQASDRPLGPWHNSCTQEGRQSQALQHEHGVLSPAGNPVLGGSDKLRIPGQVPIEKIMSSQSEVSPRVPGAKYAPHNIHGIRFIIEAWDRRKGEGYPRETETKRQAERDREREREQQVVGLFFYVLGPWHTPGSGWPWMMSEFAKQPSGN